MLFLLLATIASAGNALTMKFAGSRSENRWALLLFNYLTATVLSTLSVVRSGLAIGEVDTRVCTLGLVTGVLFIATFALLQLNVRVNGATVSSSLFRMGAAIPMALSVVLFGEYPTLAGAGGIAVAVMATAPGREYQAVSKLLLDSGLPESHVIDFLKKHPIQVGLIYAHGNGLTPEHLVKRLLEKPSTPAMLDEYAKPKIRVTKKKIAEYRKQLEGEYRKFLPNDFFDEEFIQRECYGVSDETIAYYLRQQSPPADVAYYATL